MKKLGKLSISPEKIMKNEELINLQGGYDVCVCLCFAHAHGGYKEVWNCPHWLSASEICGPGWDAHYSSC